MVRPALLAAALLLAVTAAEAQTLLSPGEYEAMSEGRTLHYTYRGQPFGSEQYFADRRSLWRYDTGVCQAGRWHAEGKNACFTYDDNPETMCWVFLRSGNRVVAMLVPRPGSPEADFVLDLSHIDDEPLDCPGPDVGM